MISTGPTVNLKRICVNAILFLVSLLATGCVTAQDIAPVETANLRETPQALLSSTPSSAPTASLESPSPPPQAVTLASTSESDEASFVVTLETGQSFDAEMRGHGATAIILANMSYGTEDQWAPLYETLDKDNYAIITYQWLHTSLAIKQTQAVLAHLKRTGFEQVICIGASLGVIACGSLADQPEIIGLVFIAGRVGRSLSDIEVPKLFIAGEGDPFARNIKSAYKYASEPKEIKLYPTVHHGTELFKSDYGDEFLDLLQTFIDETAASAP